MTSHEQGMLTVEAVWLHALKHPDHLCNGLCPDEEEPGMDSRDPECFYCRVMAVLDGALLHAHNARSAEAGLRLIAAERERQVSEEGWTAEHDDRHRHGAIALAAATYATPGTYRRWRRNQDTGETIPDTWPERWPWKPTERIRELTKAGALIAAEIDRLLRKAEKSDA